jgi:hypothetical protein
MDEMNDNELSRQIDREVSGKAGLIALVVCMAVIAGIVVAGVVVLLRQMS